jgi:hypothetical protein
MVFVDRTQAFLMGAPSVLDGFSARKPSHIECMPCKESSEKVIVCSPV